MSISATLTQRLVQVAALAAAAGPGGKQAVYRAACQELSISLPTLYRHLAKVTVKPERKQRSDAGVVSLPRAEAALISAFLMVSHRKTNKRLMSIGQALDILRANNEVRAERTDMATGEVTKLSASAVSRALKHYGLHPDQLGRAAPAVELRSLHPNHVWQIDASLCVLYYLNARTKAESGLQVMDRDKFYKNKPANLARIEADRVWSYEITCHNSGAIYVEYVLGAESAANLTHVFINAIQQREGEPFYGVPFTLMMDMGSANTSGLFSNLARRLQVQLIAHAPGNARATGQVEKARDIIERSFEAGLRLAPVSGLDELNAQARRWALWFNSNKVHSRHGRGLTATAYYQGSAEADRYREAIVMSGNAAGVTVGQLNEMAKAVSGNIGTQNEASRALAEMTRYGKVSGESLQYFTEVAMGLEKYAGQSIKSTVQDLAALGKAPLEASVKLNEQYNYLTPAVYRQIEALEKQGRTEEAAAVAQNAYVKAFESRKNEMQANLGYLEKTWYSLGNAAKWAWDRILNVGRASTDEENLAVLKQNLAAMEERNARPGFKEGKATQEKREEIRLLEEKISAQRKSALAQADEATAAQATADWGRLVNQYSSKEVQKKQELTTAEKRYNDALKAAGDDKKARNQVERDYEALVTSINKKFQERKSGAGQVSITDTQLAGLRGQLEAAQLYQEQLKNLGASASELNAGERESIKLAEQIKVATNEKTRAKLEEAKAIADALGVQLRSNDALEKTFKAQQAVIDGNYKDADALIRRAEQQEAANEVFGKGRTAIEQMTLATLEHQLAEAEGSDSFDPKYIASLEKKIEAQKRYVDALGQADYKAVMEHADELLRNAQELSKLYEDELSLSGLTELEREKIVAQRQVELKYAKELAALDKQSLTDAEKQAAREKLLEAQRVESAAAVGKAQQSYNNKMADQLNESLTDALMRGFEAGKGFAENLRDTVKNMFNTMVLRPVISAVMAPVSGVINNVVQTALGTVGLGSSNNNAGSLLSGAQNLSSLYSAVTGGITSTIGGGIASAGALFGSSALTSFAAGMKGATLAAGLAGPTTAGASGAMGLGASVGVAVPWIAAAVAIYAIAKSLDNGGTPHVGAGAVYDDGVTTGGREKVNVNQAKNWSSTTQSGVSSLATTLGGMFDGLSEAFGKEAGWRVETGFSGDGDDKSRGLRSCNARMGR